VLPLQSVYDGRCTCGRRFCKHPGKHPNANLVWHGVKDASSWEGTVDRWWTRRPESNIGIATGPSGLVVLDVDPRCGGDESLDALVAMVGDIPPTLTAISGRGDGGRHYVFTDPERRARKRDLGPGLDVLAGSTYFVAPPSMHVLGSPYRWAEAEKEPLHAPAWLVGDEA
jgi:hypothetical protein